MYEDIITKVYGDIHSQIVKQDEDKIMYTVQQSVGYKVDKDELIKALQYDRNQYQKGYDDCNKEWEEKIHEMVAEIEKYAQAMDWISGYDVILLIHKYCDKENL